MSCLLRHGHISFQEMKMVVIIKAKTEASEHRVKYHSHYIHLLYQSIELTCFFQRAAIDYSAL